MAGKRIDAAMLAEIERLYSGDELTLVQIAERAGCSASLISQLAKKHGWSPRWHRLGRKPFRRANRLEMAREAMLLRYYKTMSRYLEQMEAAMARGELSADDFERGAKTIRSMQGGVESVEKVSAAGVHADKQPKPSPAAPDDASEAERISREIMERFERIQRRRAAEGAAD